MWALWKGVRMKKEKVLGYAVLDPTGLRAKNTVSEIEFFKKKELTKNKDLWDVLGIKIVKVKVVFE